MAGCSYPDCSEPWVGYIRDAQDRMIRGCEIHLPIFQRDAEERRERGNARARQTRRFKAGMPGLFDDKDAVGGLTRTWKDREQSGGDAGS